MAVDHRVVPHDEWLEERRALPAKEKEFTRLIDLVPKGRDEEGRAPQFWVRRHDEYTH